MGGRYIGGGGDTSGDERLNQYREALLQRLNVIFDSQSTEISGPGGTLEVRDGRSLPAELRGLRLALEKSENDPKKLTLIFYNSEGSQNQPAFTAMVGPTHVSVFAGTQAAPHDIPAFIQLMAEWATA